MAGRRQHAAVLNKTTQCFLLQTFIIAQALLLTCLCIFVAKVSIYRFGVGISYHSYEYHCIVEFIFKYIIQFFSLRCGID